MQACCRTQDADSSPSQSKCESEPERSYQPICVEHEVASQTNQLRRNYLAVTQSQNDGCDVGGGNSDGSGHSIYIGKWVASDDLQPVLFVFVNERNILRNIPYSGI